MVGCSQGAESGGWRAVQEAGVPDCFGGDSCADTPVISAAPALASSLARVIEAEIIPRLLIAHVAAPHGVPASSFDQKDRVTAFTRLVREGRGDVIEAHIAQLREGGESVESLFLDLLAPSARQLGELWESDHCDFVEVTLGLVLLQRLMTGLAADFTQEKRTAPTGYRVLLLPTPGEQHTFGLSMVEKFFRRAGWDVTGGGGGHGGDLTELVRRQPFSVIGISLASCAHMGSLVSTIRAIRRCACDKAVRIMVGGAAFVDRPELGVLVGADATAVDGRAAVVVAQSLVQMQMRARAS